MGDHRTLPVTDQVVTRSILLDERLGAGWHADLERLTIGPMPKGALPVTAASPFEVRAPAEALQIA
jgi:hypothetical protein